MIMGHTNFLAPSEVKRQAYEHMAQETAAGRRPVETHPLPFEHVEEAWDRLQRGSHGKIVREP